METARSRTLNLGILAHVDAGKTSLTERLLQLAGVIDEVGSVDRGSTQTDTLALERQRGITIKSAVVSFLAHGVTINLIDTPGHPDFIAEVERVLGALDGAVLVVSAVEGVQPQTRVLMRTLRRLRIPTLIFVNKIDRRGARDEAILQEVADRLSPSVVAMGSVRDLGTRWSAFVPYGEQDVAFATGLADLLSWQDETILLRYVDDERAVSYGSLRAGLAAQAGRAVVHPVFFGSATTGAGVDSLLAAITTLLPAKPADADAPFSGTVFKIERGPAGEKIAYVRVFTGRLRSRDRVTSGSSRPQKVTAISVFDGGSAAPAGHLDAGRIGRVWGLADSRIGDWVALAGGAVPVRAPAQQFAPPTLETVIVPCDPAERGALQAALGELAEQDPLIDLRRDEVRQQAIVSLYGEVQKEVIRDTLADDYGIAVTFSESTTICVERLRGSGSAVEVLPGTRSPDTPYLAGVGLRLEPAAPGSGIVVRLGIERGSLPRAFLKAVEETVTETLAQGLFGWQVSDCTVTVTDSGYAARQSHSHGSFDKSMSSTADDFRQQTTAVLLRALERAGTVVHEPVQHFRLEAPAETIVKILPVLAELRGAVRATSVVGPTGTLEGEIPAARVQRLREQLPGLTSGEGVLESAFDRYEPVRGTPPSRPRVSGRRARPAASL